MNANILLPGRDAVTWVRFVVRQGCGLLVEGLLRDRLQIFGICKIVGGIGGIVPPAVPVSATPVWMTVRLAPTSGAVGVAPITPTFSSWVTPCANSQHDHSSVDEH